jgi:hypothetical protein
MSSIHSNNLLGRIPVILAISLAQRYKDLDQNNIYKSIYLICNNSIDKIVWYSWEYPGIHLAPPLIFSYFCQLELEVIISAIHYLYEDIFGAQHYIFLFIFQNCPSAHLVLLLP